MNQVWSTTIISHLIKCGIRHFCVAPGSRSSSLISAAAYHPLAKIHLHYDERGLGFFALGLARVKKSPVAIIVTSGSALGHLYPALMEAFATHAPLFIISADRPPEDLFCGANQTADQNHFFGRYVSHFVNIAPPETNYSLEYLRGTLTAAARKAILNCLPVHINVMLRGPFEPHTPEEFAKEERIHFIKTKPRIEFDEIAFLIDILSDTSRGLIIAAGGYAESKAIFDLAEKLSFPIFVDASSPLRCHPHPLIIPHHSLLCQNKCKGLEPEVVLQFGERLISKHLLEWLSSMPSLKYIQVKEHDDNVDPTHKTTTQMSCPIPLFCESLLKELRPKKEKTYLELFQATTLCLQATIAKELESFENSELCLSKELSLRPFANTSFFVGNGILIRAFDHLFYPKESIKAIYSSRGVSGIDGNIATVAGIATASHERLIAFIGDQAFLHDLNSLPLIRNLPITIVVVNNGGGGIFETLPMAKDRRVCGTYIVNPHEEKIASIAESFGLPSVVVYKVSDCLSLLEQGEISVIELVIDRERSTQQWMQLMESVAATKRSSLLGALSCYFT
jgi:2-succinyl-5-enolpyruvyl-6-hydroxy-3-cyclohexene-1-carboxylate synthase